MGLRLKFNLVLLGLFVVGLLVSGYMSYNFLHKNARDEIVRNAELMMEMALSVRSYTVNEVKPELESQLQHTFLPQTVPAYAATETINKLREKYPQYVYKEATLNPTNPRNLADDWESGLVDKFRNDPGHKKIIGERDTPYGRSLYIAYPIKIANPACLLCHSSPEMAPESMVALYGDKNGFNWSLNEIVGAQLVSVPMALPIENANRAFKANMGSLLMVFVVLFIALNVMLSQLIVKPITNMSQTADRMSVGHFDIPEFPTDGKDELAVLGASFNRMRRSLQVAMKIVSES